MPPARDKPVTSFALSFMAKATLQQISNYTRNLRSALVEEMIDCEAQEEV